MLDTNANPDTESPSSQSEAKIASRKLVLAACIATLIFSSVINGALDGRWADESDLRAHGMLLQQIPKDVGDWILTDEVPLETNAQEMLKCHGSLTRYYRNRITGDEIGLLLIYGPRGPVAVHVPEVCYSSAGTFPNGSPVAKTLKDEQQDSFWVTQFDRSTNGKSAFEVWYGWSTGDHWVAAKHPRFWMTHQLYKIQVAGPTSKRPSEPSPVENFLRDFVPILRNGAVSPII